MELSQRVEIPVEVISVWQSLNDPLILKQCLTGCEEFTATGDHKFSLVILAKVGPVKARFKGEITMSDIDAPNSCTLSGGGKGGVAGFAKGSANVHLHQKPDTQEVMTVMTYSVKANVGGKLAQLGSRLVNGAARKMADEFFTSFIRVVCNDPEGKLEIILETVEEPAVTKGAI